MNKQPFLWPHEVPLEAKLYFYIRLLNRRRTGKLYESAQSFEGATARSAQIYHQDCFDLDLQARGIIPPAHRDFYDVPLDYESKVKNSPLPDLPDNWDDLYLCGVRMIAIPKSVDPILAKLKPSFGDNPLESYLEAGSHSFAHWLAAATFAQENGLVIPMRPKGRVPEDLQEQINALVGPETPRENKFDVWKRDWMAGTTTQPWKGRMPVGAEYPPGYKTAKMQLAELEESLRGSIEDPADELSKVRAALEKKKLDDGAV